MYKLIEFPNKYNKSNMIRVIMWDKRLRVMMHSSGEFLSFHKELREDAMIQLFLATGVAEVLYTNKRLSRVVKYSQMLDML